jgi:phosphatidylserine decarboxylase
LTEEKKCTIYARRFKPCAAYPIDERDVRHMDCGFTFEPRPKGGAVWGLPFAPWARREIAMVGVAFLVGGGAGLGIAWLDGLPGGYAVTGAFALMFAFTLFFFRDPWRATPPGKEDLLAPADGVVTDVEEVDETEYLGGKARRVGIFMSVFDVHVNRTPVTGEVRYLRHKDGEYGNVLFERAWARNENILIGLKGDRGPVAVRLVAGAVARRIVCAVKPGDAVERGRRIGMVKFGSRAEVLVPAAAGWKPAVEVGRKVKAGVTPLWVWEGEAPGKREVGS